MDNSLEAVYIVAGLVIFILAVGLLLSLDLSEKRGFYSVYMSDDKEAVLGWDDYE